MIQLQQRRENVFCSVVADELDRDDSWRHTAAEISGGVSTSPLSGERWGEGV